MKGWKGNVKSVTAGVAVAAVLVGFLSASIYGGPKKTDLISHAKHPPIDCNDCHVAVEKSSELRRGKSSSSMGICLKCHAKEGVSQACQSCHQEQRKDKKPSFHGAGFERSHGRLSEMKNARCAVCHEENFCQDCHLESRPQNHTFLWEKRSHGRLAMIDRTSCKTCHRTDFCVACHAEICPSGSSMGWFSRPRAPQCRNCHAGATGGCPTCQANCSMCHQDTR